MKLGVWDSKYSRQLLGHVVACMRIVNFTIKSTYQCYIS